MNIAIVDDSREEQQIIHNAVADWAEKNHQRLNFSIYDNGESFIADLDSRSFDIVFMDIYMDKLSGIETAKVLRKHSLETILIFMTTSQEHMAQAFPCHAFDYIMKPIDISRLCKTLDEALKILPENQPYLDITFEKQKISILYSDLLYILSSSNYCIITVKDNEYKIRTSFNELTAHFEGYSEFFVINRGIIVNLDNVLRIDNCNCIMLDNNSIPISRRKKSEVEQAFLNRQFEKRRKGGVMI